MESELAALTQTHLGLTGFQPKTTHCLFTWHAPRPALCPQGMVSRKPSPGEPRRQEAGPQTRGASAPSTGGRGPDLPILGGGCRLPPDPSPGPPRCFPLCPGQERPIPKPTPYHTPTPGDRSSCSRRRSSAIPAWGPQGSPSPECWAPWESSRARRPAHRGARHPRPRLCSWRACAHWASGSPLETWASLERPRPRGVARTSPGAALAPSAQANARPSAARLGLASDGEGPAPRTDLTGLSWGGVLDKVPTASATRVVTEWTAPAGKACGVPSPRHGPRVSA